MFFFRSIHARLDKIEQGIAILLRASRLGQPFAGYEVREGADEFQRRYSASEFRVDKEQRKLVGYAAVFNSVQEIFPGFREVIRPGAFSKTIKEADIRCLINHDPNLVLGRNKSGTLKIWEDAKGLKYEVTLPDTSYAKDLLESVSRGDVSGSSFAFRPIKERVTTEGVHEILEARLSDVSPVTYPAYPQTNNLLGLRAKAGAREALSAWIDAQAARILGRDDLALRIDAQAEKILGGVK